MEEYYAALWNISCHVTDNVYHVTECGVNTDIVIDVFVHNKKHVMSERDANIQ